MHVLGFFVILLGVSFAIPQQAFATTITINDQASCEAIPDAIFAGDIFCILINPLTINSGDTLEIENIVLRAKSLTNYGTIEINGGQDRFSGLYEQLIHTSLFNECGGIINANGNEGELSGTLLVTFAFLSNKGTINLNGGSGSESGALSLFGFFSKVNNHGTINENPGSGVNSGILILDSGADFNDGLPNQCSTPSEPKKPGSGGGANKHLTRPTFGINHVTFEIVVDDGFKFNNQTFQILDNFHTPFAEQIINVGETNSISATLYADKGLKVQEFLFGIPEVGQAHLAELGVEVWYDSKGEIEQVKTIQKTKVVDKKTIGATHEKTKCQEIDIEENCDTTKISMVFLESLKGKVMALKAIDYKNRYQITYLNEGVDIIGKSLNPMDSILIPSNIKGEGLLQVTQTEKYSPYWVSQDGRIFEKNNFDSFKHINQKFERFEDTGNPYTRVHSGFGGIITNEQKRATQVFDSTNFISALPESFAYIFPEPRERITEEMKKEMLEQEAIAKKIIEESKVQARW